MNINEVQKDGINSIFSESRNMFLDGKGKVHVTATEEVFGAYFSENKEVKNSDITYDKYQNMSEEATGEEAVSAVNVNDIINTLSENVTSESYSQMETLGLAPKEDDLGTIVTVNERIQIQLAAYCDEYNGASLSVSSSEIKDVLGAAATGNESAISNALSMAANVKSYSENGQIPENAKAYLLGNSLEPTIENTYKAVHSGAVSGVTGTGVSISDSQWESMKAQVAGIYEGAGYEATEANLNEGRWMIENNIPLNGETIALSKKIDSINFNMTEGEISQYINDSVAAGISPEATVLAESGSVLEIAKDLVNTVNSVTGDDLNYIVTNNNDLTFEALREAREAVTKMDAVKISEMKVAAEAEAYSIKLVTAERVVYEARLMMTTGSVVQMMKMGISVDTLSLQDTVDKLKDIEGNLYKNYLTNAGVAVTGESVSLMQQTLYSANYVSYQLTYNTYEFVGKAHGSDTKTLSSLTLMQMEATYEGVGTEVRRDLGDSISKAFASIDSILESMGMELNESNRKAARILGYNSMEINEENMAAIKNLSSQLEMLTKNLTPQTVVNLIKDGINPLNMEISQLNEQLELINNVSDNKSNDEKYSKFLWKLDRANVLSDDERAAYIGMYRLISWAGKNDGDVLGSLYKQGSDVNLKNLLTAARTKKVKGIDAVLDDTFGVTEEVTKLDDIERDITKVMTDTNVIEYTEGLLKKAESMATPDGFAGVLAEENPGSFTPEQLYEKLAATADTHEEAYIKEQVEEMKQTGMVSEEAVRSILDNNMPVSVNNLLAAGMLYRDTRAAYARIKRFADTDAIEEAIKSGDEDQLKSAIEETADEITKKLDELTNEAEATYDVFKEAIFAGNMMTVMANMSRNRHYVVESTINEKSTVINLSVGTGNNDTVGISMKNELYGEITAEFKIVENSLYGTVGADNDEAVAMLEEQVSELVEAFADMGFDEVKIDISIVTVSVNSSQTYGGEVSNGNDLRLFETAKKVIGWL